MPQMARIAKCCFPKSFFLISADGIVAKVRSILFIFSMPAKHRKSLERSTRGSSFVHAHCAHAAIDVT